MRDQAIEDEFSLQDEAYMQAALQLAHRGLGATAPNPSVGALLVRPDLDRMVGRGTTAAGGRPHAEALAIAEAGDLARGSTLYVTLEPCSHFGRTGPCVDQVISAGVSRVVSAIEDPDPRVAGRGHQKLRDAGIQLVTGALQAEAARVNAGHISRIVRGRPHVVLKLAVSADGMIGIKGKGQIAISGPDVKPQVYMIRAMSDAILIGAGTAREDNPRLTCRLPGMEHLSPIRVVADTNLSLNPKSALFDDVPDVPVWVIGSEGADAARAERLESAGASIIRVPVGPDGRISMPFALAALAARGVTRLMVEGGARLSTSLLKGNLVDEAYITACPESVVGACGTPALDGLEIDDVFSARRFEQLETRVYGPDQMTRYWRKV
ncbi:MAG: bifunctional diaminohydroxyphosphoribosylaminopyrimidine deaminase/5-amino-6-(5-phosphoribosylamino)uracil reductase RibD [Pseudomonadota bacterium]